MQFFLVFSTFSSAKAGGGALVFNVENIDNDQLATDNDKATVSEVSGIAADSEIIVVPARVAVAVEGEELVKSIN